MAESPDDDIGVVVIEGWNMEPTDSALSFLREVEKQFDLAGFATLGGGADYTSLSRLVKEAEAAYRQGDQAVADEKFGEALEQLRYPTSGDEGALLGLRMKVVVYGSQSRYRSGDKRGGREFLKFAERWFPEVAIPRSAFGPESIARRAKLAAKMARKRRAALTVLIEPSGDIFVDGLRVRGRQATDPAHLRLHAGTYRVTAVNGDAQSASVQVELKPGEKRKLSLVVPQGEALVKKLGASRIVLLSLWDNRLVKGVLYRKGKKVREARVKVGDSLESFVDELAEVSSEADAALVDRALEFDPPPKPEDHLYSELAMVMGGTTAAIGLFIFGVGLVVGEDNENQDVLLGLGGWTAAGGAVLFSGGALGRWVF